MPPPTGPILWFSLIALMAMGFPGLPRDLQASEGTACHPAVAPKQANYVIGYGSLMSGASKERSWQHAGDSLPVRLRGFQRSWSARGRDIGFSTTYLGIEPKEGAEMVAALYRVYDAVDFATGDTREYIYCRAPVDPAHISMLDGSAVPSLGRIWIYVLKPESSHAPDAGFPIIQSYVDIFLSGCMELARRVVGEDFDFLTACITTRSMD